MLLAPTPTVTFFPFGEGEVFGVRWEIRNDRSGK